jgi:6-phosphofructokinase 1
MRFGIEGFLSGNVVNLSAQSDNLVNGLSGTPSSILGSSRYKLKDEDLKRVRDELEKHNIRYFFLIGGNDTMDTVHRVESYCREGGYELYGIGIPKTVDNDLFGTDHTPGYPSAARYNALSVQQSGRLARDMKRVDRFVIYQTVGREAGWLAAAAALARRDVDDPPHLIYCPENPFHRDEFLQDAISCMDRIGYVSIVVSEGLKYPDGTPVSAAEHSDRFGNTEYGAMGGSSVGLNVHRILREATGYRGEFQITESLPMCAIDRAAPGDIRRAELCGSHAVTLASSGKSGLMVSILRKPGDTFDFGQVPLSDVAVRAREMPRQMFNKRGNDVTQAFLDWARPLLGPMPEYVSLEEIR